MASNSSKKIIEGAISLAFLKSSLIALSDSPIHLFKSSGPFMLIKFALISFATASAKRVFPLPDGPYKRNPLGAVNPAYLYNLFFFSLSVFLTHEQQLL